MTLTHTAQVPSRTQAGTTYVVSVYADGATSCTCPVGQHGRACWHQRSVRLTWLESCEQAERDYDAYVADMERRRAAEIAEHVAAHAGAYAVCNNRRGGGTVSVHPTYDEAARVAAECNRAGGWCGVYRI